MLITNCKLWMLINFVIRFNIFYQEIVYEKSCLILKLSLPLRYGKKIVTYGGYFEAFMETLTDKEQEKIQYGLLLLKTQDRLPKKFVKLIRKASMS